jgi:hypothetical protein
MNHLLIWEEIPENTRAYVLVPGKDDALIELAKQAHGYVINAEDNPASACISSPVEVTIMPLHSDTPALSAAPPNAILVWCDGVNIFAEFPGPQGLPVVVRYPLTTTGLASVLSLIRTRTFDTHDREYTPSRVPIPGTTHAQYENAKVILRRLGVLG